MTRSTDPSKNVFKNPQKNSTIRPSNIICVAEFKQNQCDKHFTISTQTRSPFISLSCAGFKTQIPMHSNSNGCPKIVPLSAPVLHWLSHPTWISSLKVKNERKTLIFTQLKISRYNQHFFAIFGRVYKVTSNLFTVVCPQTLLLIYTVVIHLFRHNCCCSLQS